MLYEVITRNPGWKVPKLLVFAATLAGSAGVFLTYGTLLGRNAGVALLVVMLALKLLELRRLRVITSYSIHYTKLYDGYSQTCGCKRYRCGILSAGYRNNFV